MEDIKILEEYISEWNECLKNSNVGNLEAWKEVKKQIKVNQAIENLIARNKELEKELLSKSGIYKIDINLKDDYIPKSKIKEKIEFFNQFDNEMVFVKKVIIKELQELLD